MMIQVVQVGTLPSYDTIFFTLFGSYDDSLLSGNWPGSDKNARVLQTWYRVVHA